MNNVQLIGRIVNDLELKTVGQGSTLLNFSVAYNEKWGNKEESYFFDIVSWGKQAETIASYFKKGQRIGLSGKLKQERFQDKEGNNRSKVVVVLRDFTFIESKNTSGTSGPPSSTSPKNTNEADFDNFSAQDLDDEVPF